MLSVSDKSDSVNECTQEISELMKLHIQGVWQSAYVLMFVLAVTLTSDLLTSKCNQFIFVPD